MNTRRLAIVGISLAAAFLVAVLVSFVFGSGSGPVVERIVERIEDVPTVGVLVATAEVSAGERLSPEKVEWKPWPAQLLSSNLITKTVAPNAVEIYAGALVRERIFAGEPIDSRKVVSKKEGGGYMSLLLQPGMRAFSVPLSVDEGAGGFVLPGDRVDVMATWELRGGADRRVVSQLLLENVRVLAIDQKTVSEKGSLVGKVVTLEVSPDQVRTLAAAREKGELSLALRGASESDKKVSGEKKRVAGGVTVVNSGSVGVVTLD